MRCVECGKEGMYYYFPDGKRISLCPEHARQFGFCPMCAGFWGGVEFFEVHGVCLECYSEFFDEEDYCEEFEEADT